VLLAGGLWLLSALGSRPAVAVKGVEPERAALTREANLTPPAPASPVERAPPSERAVASPTLPVSTSGEPERLTPEARGFGTILGEVVDLAGAPVAEAPVRLAWLERTYVADAQGRFEIHDLEAGRYMLDVGWDFLPEGWISSPVKLEIPTTGGSFKVRLNVAAGATLLGRVIGPAGEPWPEFEVRVHNELAESSLQMNLILNGKGGFRMQNVWPGEGWLEVRPHENRTLARFPSPRPSFRVGPGESFDLGVIAFESGPCSIRGSVIDQDGRVVGGIAVVCEGLIASTDPSGRFEFFGLQHASYAVRIGVSGHAGHREVFADDRRAPELKADLSAGVPNLDLGVVRILRDRLFEVHGRIDPGTSGIHLGEVGVRVESTGDVLRSESRSEHLTYDAENGTFACTYLPEEGRSRLTFVVWRGSEELERLSVRAVPDRVEELVIRLPE
jgi:hypothetical protein